MDIDNVLSHIGDFGRAQKKIYFLVSLTHVFLGFHTLILSFIGTDPGWKCVPGKIQGIPLKNGNVLQGTTTKCFDLEQGHCTPEYLTEYTSIVTEWNLICSKSSLPNLSQSWFFVGFVIGSWVFGNLAEKIGRKKVLFLTILGSCFSGLGYTLAPEFYSFAFFRGLTALCCQGTIISGYVLSMEIVGISARSFVGLAIAPFFAVGCALLAGLAFFIRDWRALSLVCTLSGLPLLFLWRIVPESPRWLLLNGQEEQARAVLAGFARGNGVTLPEGKLKKPEQSKNGGVSTQDLFRGKIIRQRTTILVFAWFVNCVVYYALAMSAGNFGGDRYVSFTLSGLVDIPSAIICYFLINSSGRKWTHGGLLIASGLGCLGWVLLHWMGGSTSLKMIVALLGKFSVAGSFAVLYLYSAELFPTQVRNLGMGLSGVGSRIGGIIAPLVLLLSQYSDVLPMLLMGGLALTGGVFGLSLPETLNQPLPETLAELEPLVT